MENSGTNRGKVIGYENGAVVAHWVNRPGGRRDLVVDEVAGIKGLTPGKKAPEWLVQLHGSQFQLR
jgi:hypothetical protein